MKLGRLATPGESMTWQQIMQELQAAVLTVFTDRGINPMKCPNDQVIFVQAEIIQVQGAALQVILEKLITMEQLTQHGLTH